KALWKYSQCRSIIQELGKGNSVQDYSLDSSSQLLLFKDWVVVANDPTIQLSILQKRHDSPLTGQTGKEKTLKLFKRDFPRSGMTQFIKDYVSSSQQCSRNKNIHDKKFGLLKPLPIPNGAWICLSMDFITKLPLSNSFDSILVIVNRFSKMKLKISRDLSTAYHPETDGQKERENQILEQYLWIDPQFDSAHITQDTPAGKLSPKIQLVQQDVKRELEFSIKRFKRYEDKSRASPPVFNLGEMVWLSSKNIKSTRPTKKMSERWLGPFPILKKISNHPYHLKLPSQWKFIHPVFHTSLLEPVKTSTIQNWHHKPPPPIIIEEGDKCQMSKEDQINVISYANLFTSLKFSFQNSIPLEPLCPIHLNSLKRLVPYLGAQELTIQGRWVLSQPQRIIPQWVLWQFSLNPVYGKLAI
ncbi:hypothetical protein O181_021941, partial [Austropuccinia psidii MF-1]|nr:hypothetical protein [Austropuccinia psidii MF-1]